MSGGAYVTGWALETDYPAGPNPWNGQPCKVTPVGDIFTPQTPFVPEFMNWKLNELSAGVQAVQAASYQPALQNWYAEQAITPFAGTSESLMAACWMPKSNVWAIAIQGSTGPQLSFFASYGLDGNTQATWLSLGTISANPPTNVSIREDATTAGDLWVAYSASTSGGEIITNLWNGSSWGHGGTTYIVSTGPLPSANLVGTLHAFNGNVVVGIGSLSANGGGFYPNPNTGATSPSYSITGVTTGTIKFADNAGYGGPNDLLVAVPTGTEGVDVYWTSPDGVSWTQQTLGAPIVPSTSTIFGICWSMDAVGPCFLLGVFHNSSGDCDLWRSADGINWTEQMIATPGKIKYGTDLKAIGPAVYLATLDVASAGASFAAFSPDGGITFYLSQAVLTSNIATGNPYYTPRLIAASPCGFLTYNSLWFRFSHLSGVTGLPLLNTPL